MEELTLVENRRRAQILKDVRIFDHFLENFNTEDLLNFCIQPVIRNHVRLSHDSVHQLFHDFFCFLLVEGEVLFDLLQGVVDSLLSVFALLLLLIHQRPLDLVQHLGLHFLLNLLLHLLGRVVLGSLRKQYVLLLLLQTRGDII